MTNKEIKEFRSTIDRLLVKGNIGDAFEELRNAARTINSWRIIDRIEKAEQSYGYMLRYMIDGIDDPSRDEVFRSLKSEIATIRDILTREFSLPETPTLYYNTLRSVSSHRDETLLGLTEQQRASFREMSPFNAMSSGTVPSDSDKLRAEMNERDIFNRLWVSFPLNVDDMDICAEFIADQSLPVRTRALCVSAITLSLLEFFDERKLRMLADAYTSDDTRISIRALTGLALVLDKYRNTTLSEDMRNRLSALKEQSGWKADIRQIFVELIRTNDTRRISAKLNEEIFPEIKRMGQSMADKLSELQADIENRPDDLNPEWEDLLSDQRIRDNLKELGELQQEGADVFMTTFSSLKQFPFFNEVANWFLIFDPEHSVITSLGFGESSPIGTIIDTAPYICDSDKYSMALSLSMMPENQRTMMTSQLSQQNEDLDQLLAAAGSGSRPVDRNAEINSYVHSLYRFYHLFRRKGEFYNPFDHVVNPADIPAVSDDFNTQEALMSLGEFYFKTRLYNYARRIFTRLDGLSSPRADRYQKLGFCCEKLGDLDAAASYYEQADLLDGASQWNLRRLSSVYRRLGQYSSAIDAASRLEALQPDNAETAATLANLFILSGNYSEAISRLQKIEFNDPDNPRYLRPLAWALMMNRDFESAATYYDRIISSDPTATDLLNAGHLAWATRRIGEAINYYRLSAERSTLEKTTEAIRSDASALERIGIDTSVMPLVIDALIYSMKK